MRFLLLLTMLGCGANKTRMTGVIATDEIYFDGWVSGEITNAPSSPSIWIRLDKKQLEQAKKGTNVVFYVQAKEVHNEGW